MPEARRLLVTGATGYIGGEVAGHFTRKGWEVLALARRPPASPGLRHVPYDLHEPPAPESLMLN